MFRFFAWRRVAKEPLFHFMLAGALAFVWFSLTSGESGDEIVVDRRALISFIQYRTKAFEPDVAAARLDLMSSAEKQQLIDDYVREEAVYREARRMNLDQGDYVIRQRLIQKYEFIAGATMLEDAPSEQELQAFYRRNMDSYASPATATFTEIFFSREGHEDDRAIINATLLVKSLRNGGVAPRQARDFNDGAFAIREHAGKTREAVASALGDSVAVELFETMKSGEWSGPVSSEYGVHVFFLEDRKGKTVAAFEDSKPQLVYDWRRQKAAAHNNVVIADIIKRYKTDIRVTADIE